ncbi:hypothetical protein BBP40_007903 [Aspergillus hancockii]|nr:hypothetical protein BBP40_007903 [Aspergillus hancockii]
MAVETALVGPFEIRTWPDTPGSLGTARHHITNAEFSVKAECLSSLAHEAHTLHAASGGVGVPLLHWFETVNGRDIMITDPYGPCLEEVFCQSGRYFSMQTLLHFAEQLLSRVEFIHSRNIVHGNLNPWSFALGSREWQNQQILLVDFNTQIAPKATIRDDLYAIGRILGYFYSGSDSWEHYQQKAPRGYDSNTAPVFVTFCHAVSSHSAKSINYGFLKEIFHGALHDFAFHLGVALDLRGSRAIGDGLSPKMGALLSMTTTSLFDTLSLKLSEIGKRMKTLAPAPTSSGLEWVRLLKLFEDVLKIYTVLLVRDRPSKTGQVIGAYHLPNRLWRDLVWFLKSTHDRTDDISRTFQLTFIEMAYTFITALYEIVPSYRLYWTEYIFALARARKDLEPSSGKPAWIQTVFYWQDRFNQIKEQTEAIKQREIGK